ncbi:MAG: hypothetical protein JWN55_1690 [Frankiales bacterium]|nr:hypothetical protein [Frankiales bacterium]
MTVVRGEARVASSGGTLADHLRARHPEVLNPTSPWVLAEQVRLGQLLAVGLVAMLAGWYGLAGTVALSRQAGFLVVAIGGLVLSSVGLSLWLLAGLRAIRVRRVLVREGLLVMVADLPAPVVRERAVDEPTSLVASPAMTHYHRPSCLLVEGKTVAQHALAAHLQSGRTPCGVCAP